MGLLGFAKHVYSYFSQGAVRDADATKVEQEKSGYIVYNSYVPVYSISGDLVRYIEREPEQLTASKLVDTQSRPSHQPKDAISEDVLYTRGPNGQYTPYSRTTVVSASVSKPAKKSFAPVLKPADPSLDAGSTDATWDGWTDGPLELDFTHKEFLALKGLPVHWATSTNGGKGGSDHADIWQEGKKSIRKCLGVIECTNPVCQIIVRPHARSKGIATQLERLCQCGAELIRQECDVVSYLFTWTEGIHYSNSGFHLHRRPTHLLHLLPHERTRFESLVKAHPKSGPLQLIIGVPTLHGPGESVADVSPVFVNADRVGKERLKILKGVQEGDIEGVFATFAEFEIQNPEFVTQATIGKETVISVQSPFMRSQLVKDSPVEGPLNGLVSDATHSWWKDRKALLMISSTYCLILRCWVPGIFSYMNGATAQHLRHHFFALIHSIALEAESRNIVITNALFAGMMDFSDAERNGFALAFIQFWINRTENTLTRAELQVVAERLLKGCREHFRASIERLSKMHSIIRPDQKSDFCQRAIALLNLSSSELFAAQAALLIIDFPNVKDWVDWWMRPSHAQMLFESERKMDLDLWRSIPDSNNAEEAMNGKIYKGCGRDHLFLEGLYYLKGIAAYYSRLYDAAGEEGTPIRHGQPEPWKGAAEKLGHTKPSRAIELQLVKKKKNDGRPPDTLKELTKKRSKKTVAAIELPSLGPPSYKWSHNSCWLDSSLEVLYVSVCRNFEDFSACFTDLSNAADSLYAFYSCLEMRHSLGEDADDGLVTRTLVNQRDTLRRSLLKSGAIKGIDTNEALLGWLFYSMRMSDPTASFPVKQYLSVLMVDFHSCSGSPDLSLGPHIEIVKPRFRPEIQISNSQHLKYNGSFKDYFRDYIRIDKSPVLAHSCWRIKDGDKILCFGRREDVKDLVLSLPVVLQIEVGNETRQEAPQDHVWDFPSAIYPHTRPSTKNPHGIVYDLVGLVLVNLDAGPHFIGRYASGDKKTIYTYDGLRHGGHPKQEAKAKFTGYIAGRHIEAPNGFSVIQAFYYLRGGSQSQQEFYKIRTQALFRRFNLKFERSSPSVIPSVSIRSSLGLTILPHHNRQEWKALTSTIEYVSASTNVHPNMIDEAHTLDHDGETEKSISVSDLNEEIVLKELTGVAADISIPEVSHPADIITNENIDSSLSLSLPKSPASSLPDSLFSLNCRCGVSGNGNVLYRADREGEAVQCSSCTDWSHIACQRNGSACQLPKDDRFLCHECDPESTDYGFPLNYKKKLRAPTRSSERHAMEKRTLSKKPLKQRLRRGRGVLAKHSGFWYPARLISLENSDGKMSVRWWRGCEFIEPGERPDDVSCVPASDIIDSLWGDRRGRRQVQLGKWKQSWFIPSDEDILADPSSIPYSAKINQILTPARDVLYNLLYDSSTVSSADVPAKAWLENQGKNPGFKGLIPYTGPLTITECAEITNWFEQKITGRDKSLRRDWISLLPHAHAYTVYIASFNPKGDPKKTALERAWDAQITPRIKDRLTKDVDLECLTLLEEEMFENSQRAGVSGNEQWGLDVGNHQDDWKPYGCIPEQWIRYDREYSDSEYLPGENYVDFPKAKPSKSSVKPRPKPRPILKRKK